MPVAMAVRLLDAAAALTEAPLRAGLLIYWTAVNYATLDYFKTALEAPTDVERVLAFCILIIRIEVNL